MRKLIYLLMGFFIWNSALSQSGTSIGKTTKYLNQVSQYTYYDSTLGLVQKDSSGGIRRLTLYDINNNNTIDNEFAAAVAKASRGTIIDMTNLGGTNNFASNVSFGKSGITVLLPKGKITFTAGRQITVSGDGNEFVGMGDSSIFDISGWTSTQNTSPIKITGNNNVLKNFKMIGDRITRSDSGNNLIKITGSKTTVSGITLWDGSANGVDVSGSDNIMQYLKIQRVWASGIISNAGSWNHKICFNNIDSAALGRATGSAGIRINGSTSAVSDSVFLITHNTITHSGQIGITVNSGNSYVLYPTKQLDISDNIILNTGDITQSSDGEGISFTGMDIIVSRNIIQNTATQAILSWNCGRRIQIVNNILSNTSLDTAAANPTHPGITIEMNGSANGSDSLFRDYVISGNSLYDNQISSTSGNTVKFQIDGTHKATHQRILVFGNTNGVANKKGFEVDNDSLLAKIIAFGNTDSSTVDTSGDFHLYNDLRLENGMVVTDSSIVASATNLSLGSGSVFSVSGTTQIDSIVPRTTPKRIGFVTLVFQGSLQVTDGLNLVLAGNFSATANDVLTLWHDGVRFYYEVSRSAN